MHNESQATTKKNGRSRGSGSRYSVYFILIAGITGLLCIVAAIVLTIIGTVGLRDYGFNNDPLIAGIILFGIAGVLLTFVCLSAVLK